MATKRTPSQRTRKQSRTRPVRAARRSPETPIAGPQAFTNLVDPLHVQSQAAALLLIGSELRGDAAVAEARARAARAFQPPSAAGGVEALPADDVAALGFPRMPPGAARFLPTTLERAAGVRFTARQGPTPAPRDVRTAASRLPRVAEAFYRDANPETAAALLEVSLRHPHELARVAAAVSYLEVAVDPTPALRILERGVRSRDRLIRDVAAHALAHVDPRNGALERLLVARRRPSRRRRSRTSLIVHGTWGQASSWWQPPTGDFWKYLHDNVDAQLYGAPDRFDWSGGYSDVARALAGSDLRDWVLQHSLDGLDLFTHSHGASVAMLANQAGIHLGRLVLLSCPVHWPKYAPDFTRVTKVVSVRVHLDLVILVDRGGQRFSDSRITEHVLPIWFDHFATHDPGTWVQHRVDTML
jgi:hypothetical protein